VTAYAAPCISGEIKARDILGEDDLALSHATDIDAVYAYLDELPERDQPILMLRFYGNLTQEQIGDRLGISQMHVSRLLHRALTYLRVPDHRVDITDTTGLRHGWPTRRAYPAAPDIGAGTGPFGPKIFPPNGAGTTAPAGEQRLRGSRVGSGEGVHLRMAGSSRWPARSRAGSRVGTKIVVKLD
jgi:hypothetical protein